MLRSILFIFTILSSTAFAQQAVDAQNSSVKWTGKKVTGQHEGLVKIQSGQLNIEEDVIKGGSFVMDMTTISCTDIKTQSSNQSLVGHLKSDDFFGVNKYPTAKLVILEPANFVDNNAKVNAKVTIKNKSQTISFDVKKSNGGYEAEIVIDRSKFDVRYGSGSFFDNLGDNMIYDDFTLNVNLVMKN